MGLLACPFCREMFEEGEAASCPVCGVALTQFEKLPPSIDALHDDESAPTAPELERLPLTYFGRGRGPLAVLALGGLGLFFVPWVHQTMPYIDAKSAFNLASDRIGWLWACFACWMVLVPTVLSRRTIAELRGARVAAAFLSAIPTVAIGILLAKPPHGRIIRVEYTWSWALWATLVISLLGIFVAIRLGGRADDIKVARGSGSGQTLH